jgi:DNA primase
VVASNDPIADIKARLDIVDVVSQKVALKKSGSTYKGLCPFHTEKSPSFIVFPDKGNYHCFGCGSNGDLFSFVMKTENLDFPEALRALAGRAGIELKSRHSDDASGQRRSQLIQLLEQATVYYQQGLRGPEGEIARSYLDGRGLAQATIDQFRLGWAPDHWDSLYQFLVERGAKPELIVAAGLAAERDTGGYYDRIRGRVVFPIVSDRGDLVGYGARTLGDGQPKYLNSPQTELFDKGASLYGIDQAKASIRATNRVTVVEGYLDVLIAHQFGFKDVVASLGTALTERQVGILKKLTRTVVLALDSDAAGDAAAVRGLDVVRQVYGDAQVAVPLPRGLVRLESRLGADILIAGLPRTRDPDEIIRESPDVWRAIVDEAQPVVEYYFDLVLTDADLSSTKTATAAVRKLLPIIGEVRDPVQQALYLQRLAERVRIPEQLLVSELSRQRLTARIHPVTEEVEDMASPRRRSPLDEHALSLLLMYPGSARSFADELRDDDWELVESRQIFQEICLQFADGGQIDRALLLRSLPEPVADWLSAVLSQAEGRPPLDDKTLLKERDRTIGDLRQRFRRSNLNAYSILLRDLEGTDDADGAAQLQRQVEHELSELGSNDRRSGRARVWSVQA